jgi:ribosomal protein L37AE/L43A
MENGPTLNEAFNVYLKKRNPFGHGEPECEECGSNLTDKHVYHADGMWVCEKCQHALLENKKNDRYRNRHDV